MGTATKKMRGFFLLAVIAIATFVFSPDSFAATIDDLKRSIEQKNAEIKKLEEEASQYRDGIFSTQRRGKTLKEELLRISNLITQFKRDISLTERKIEKKNFEIQELSVHIADKEASIQRLRTGLGNLIEVISQKDNEPLVATLLRSGVLSDFFRELDSTSLVQNKIINSLGNIRSLKRDLEIEKANAQDKKNDLESFEDTLRDQKKMQEGTRQERTGLLQSRRLSRR